MHEQTISLSLLFLIFLSPLLPSPPSLLNPLATYHILLKPHSISSTLPQPPPILSPLSGAVRSAMVSLRRRKLLGLSSGRNSSLPPLPRTPCNKFAPETPVQNTRSVIVQPSADTNNSNERNIPKVDPGSSDVTSFGSSTEQYNQQFPVQEVKRRKRHRRKHVDNQEPCVMRGVYFKNMKWQAAIKVDKRQIHLGTVGSQEEAAHLYDRAAFMCGREPNFELSEDEKQQLSKFNWDEFLAMTRSTISNKKHQRRSGSVGLRKYESSSMLGSDCES